MPSVMKIIVSESALVLLHTAGVSIWKFPALSSSTPVFLYGDLQPVPPLITLRYDHLAHTMAEHACYDGPCDWYSGTHQRLIYDVSWPDKPNSFHRYEVVVDEDMTEGTLVLLSIVSIPDRTRFQTGPSRFHNDGLVSWWFEQTSDGSYANAHFHLLPVNNHSTETIASDIIGLHTSDILSNMTSSFCGLSGRFALLDEDRNIYLFDFLSSPPSELVSQLS